MFRCFDSLEFELKDVSSSSTGFGASANLAPDATSQLASLFYNYPQNVVLISVPMSLFTPRVQRTQ